MILQFVKPPIVLKQLGAQTPLKPLREPCTDSTEKANGKAIRGQEVKLLNNIRQPVFERILASIVNYFFSIG